MTEHINAITVILDHDTREDECEAIISAIHQLRGVLDVKPHTTNHMESLVQHSRVTSELFKRVMDVFVEYRKGN